MKPLVVCDDNRYESWSRLLLNAGAESIFVKLASGAIRIDPSNVELGGKSIKEEEISERVSCALVHQGDKSSWENLNVSADHVFWFNKPGKPDAPNGDLPILRETDPFNIGERCAREILEYSAGERAKIPSCCRPKKTTKHLNSLSLLCQGALMAHALDEGVPFGENAEIALEKMGWKDLDADMKESLSPDTEATSSSDWWRQPWGAGDDIDVLEDEAQTEWVEQEAANGEEENWQKVRDLIQCLADEITPSSEQISEAYLSLHDRL